MTLNPPSFAQTFPGGVLIGVLSERPIKPYVARGSAAFFFATDTQTVYMFTDQGQQWQVLANNSGRHRCHRTNRSYRRRW